MWELSLRVIQLRTGLELYSVQLSRLHPYPVPHSALLCVQALCPGCEVMHLEFWFLEGKASTKQQVFSKHLLCALEKVLCEAKACEDGEIGAPL